MKRENRKMQIRTEEDGEKQNRWNVRSPEAERDRRTEGKGERQETVKSR